MLGSDSELGLSILDIWPDVVHSTGLEPVACPLGGGRSIHLSYGCVGWDLNTMC